jgi:putative transposase
MALHILNVIVAKQKHHRKEANAMSMHKVLTKGSEINTSTIPIADTVFDLEQLMHDLELDMKAFATSAGVAMMKRIIDREVQTLAGERHTQTTDINRWGSQKGSVISGGQRVTVDVPRIRTREGTEVPLESYRAFRRNEPRTKAVFDRLVAGVSCRDYAGTVEKLVDGYGISRSVASREMIQATAKDLKALVERDLLGIAVYVLLIDGIHLGDTVMIVAEGVDSTGKKHMLGFREGSTENSRVCLDLLHDLTARHLAMDHPMLIVIDGSPALRSAVDKFFGANAFVQRCQQHKRENVMHYLADERRAEYARKLKAAWSMNSYQDGHRALSGIVADLERINANAAHSLKEGFEETLTLHRLELPLRLRRSFSTTNLIESAFSYGRRVMRNVKRWRNSAQAQRWTATALLRTEKRFRKIPGYQLMPVLINALYAHAENRGQIQKSNVA